MVLRGPSRHRPTTEQGRGGQAHPCRSAPQILPPPPIQSHPIPSHPIPHHFPALLPPTCGGPAFSPAVARPTGQGTISPLPGPAVPLRCRSTGPPGSPPCGGLREFKTPRRSPGGAGAPGAAAAAAAAWWSRALGLCLRSRGPCRARGSPPPGGSGATSPPRLLLLSPLPCLPRAGLSGYRRLPGVLRTGEPLHQDQVSRLLRGSTGPGSGHGFRGPRYRGRRGVPPALGGREVPGRGRASETGGKRAEPGPVPPFPFSHQPWRALVREQGPGAARSFPERRPAGWIPLAWCWPCWSRESSDCSKHAVAGAEAASGTQRAPAAPSVRRGSRTGREGCTGAAGASGGVGGTGDAAWLCRHLEKAHHGTRTRSAAPRRRAPGDTGHGGRAG
ncbi:uncharacterized protein LOC142055977 isoform X1 [Phalacrocorax aristotelis]|uniref:uncharacterized protein LOC142055977 isoform X1 n=1 Tax=Phalacrocorax aristotelis TaxID=126867 RepID=UPI003F4C21B2